MKAPDKIYAMIVAGTLYADTKQHEVFNKPYAEYIRKDALMEWLEGKKKHYMDRQEYDCGWNDLLDDIIDKLNSM